MVLFVIPGRREHDDGVCRGFSQGGLNSRMPRLPLDIKRPSSAPRRSDRFARDRKEERGGEGGEGERDDADPAARGRVGLLRIVFKLSDRRSLG